MKNQKLMNAIGGVDDKYIEESEPKGTVPKRKSLRVRGFAFAAASLALVIALAAAFKINPFHSENVTPPSKQTLQVSSSAGEHQADSELLGLPVENFSLADVNEENGVSMDRMLFSNFADVFRNGVDCFVAVKIENTRSEASDIDSYFKAQISDGAVLQNIYGNCELQTLTIQQSVIVDHFCLGTTNLLREGAVYLLPLKEIDGICYISGDMDFLLEVDDKGILWSHSEFEDFNKYDGQRAEEVIAEIRKLTEDEDFMLANSPFGALLQSHVLADLTITGKSETLSNEIGNYYTLSFNVNEFFDGHASELYENTGNITVYEDNTTKLTMGNRYLIFLDYYEDEVYANPHMIARLDEASSLEAIPADTAVSFGKSIFTAYNGYKIDEIREIVGRINAWNEVH